MWYANVQGTGSWKTSNTLQPPHMKSSGTLWSSWSSSCGQQSPWPPPSTCAHQDTGTRISLKRVSKKVEIENCSVHLLWIESLSIKGCVNSPTRSKRPRRWDSPNLFQRNKHFMHGNTYAICPSLIKDTVRREIDPGYTDNVSRYDHDGEKSKHLRVGRLLNGRREEGWVGNMVLQYHVLQ